MKTQWRHADCSRAASGPAELTASSTSVLPMLTLSQIPPKHPTKHWHPMNARKRRNTTSSLASSNAGISPSFVVSADGLLGKEAKTLLSNFPPCLQKNGRNPIPKSVDVSVNARMSVAIVSRATCLCRSPIPTSKMSRRLPQWEDKAGLGLFRH
jgi:hypothetical protein